MRRGKHEPRDGSDEESARRTRGVLVEPSADARRVKAMPARKRVVHRRPPSVTAARGIRLRARTCRCRRRDAPATCATSTPRGDRVQAHGAHVFSEVHARDAPGNAPGNAPGSRAAALVVPRGLRRRPPRRCDAVVYRPHGVAFAPRRGQIGCCCFCGRRHLMQAGNLGCSHYARFFLSVVNKARRSWLCL